VVPGVGLLSSGRVGGVFAIPASAYDYGATSGQERADAAVIDDTMAERMVACGWIAASAAGVFMVALGVMAGFAIGWVYITGAVVLFALAYGIYRRSRVCAVLILLNHFLGVVGLFARAREVPPTEIAVTLVLGVFYVLGVIGTFLHHARERTAAA
jgi:hypothetical protein